MQAKVFFGKEPNLGIKVVLKQYTNDLRGMFWEIRIFTELERMNKRKFEQDIVSQVESFQNTD